MLEKLLARTIADENGCLVWQGFIDPNGYANGGYYQRRGWRTHRLTYTLAKGEIPKGLVVHHECRNRACINPEHLRAVTQAENLAEAHKNNTHCRTAGHELTPENTYVTPSAGFRRCLICKKNRRREQHHNLNVSGLGTDYVLEATKQGKE